MDIKAAYNRIKLLITYPTKELKLIKKESFGPMALIGRFLMPVLLLYFICSLLGNVFFTNDIEHGALYKISYVFGRLLLIITGFLLSILVLQKVYRKMEIEIKAGTLFTLVFYAYLVVWIVASFMGLLANYKSLIRFMHLFSLYGLVLYWMGFEAWVVPSKDKKNALYFWTFFILAAIYLLVFFMLKKLMLLLMIVNAVSQI